MRPSPSMTAVIDRVRYHVGSAMLLAHDAYWDGHNFERHGHNTFLYRSPGGKYFAVHLTQWEGERDSIEPLDPDAAYDLYEDLSEREVEVEQAFPGVRVVDA